MDTFACSCYSCILTMFILMSKFQQSYACQTLLYHPSSHTDYIVLYIPLSPLTSHCTLYTAHFTSLRPLRLLLRFDHRVVIVATALPAAEGRYRQVRVQGGHE